MTPKTGQMGGKKDKLEFIKIKNFHVSKDIIRSFPGGSVVKNPPVNTGGTGSIPDLGRSHMLQSS